MPRKTPEESWQEGRKELLTILLKHRRAIERMTLDRKINPEDRLAILACVSFAYYEMLHEPTKQPMP